MCNFNVALLLAWWFNTLTQKKYSRNCHPHFLLDCCMTPADPTVAKHSLLCQKTLQSTEGAPFQHVITDSFLKNIVAVLFDPHLEKCC